MRQGLHTSIRLKLTLLVIGALSVVSYLYAHRKLRQEIHARLSVIVSDRQKLVLSYIHQQQERVALVASRPRLRQLLAEGAAAPSFAEETRRILEDARSSAAVVRAIWVADANGRVIAATEDCVLRDRRPGIAREPHRPSGS